MLETRVRRGPHVIALGSLVIGILWALTLMASDAPWSFITVFWVLVGGGIVFWVWRDASRDIAHLSDSLRAYASALRRNEAEVFDIQAKSFVELEEVEDEGACYAFEIEGGRIVFVVGQAFYPEARFPSRDFSLVHILDERGKPADMVIQKRGLKAPPARIVPADIKRHLEIPEHLEMMRGSLDAIENLLSRRSS